MLLEQQQNASKMIRDVHWMQKALHLKYVGKGDEGEKEHIIIELSHTRTYCF